MLNLPQVPHRFELDLGFFSCFPFPPVGSSCCVLTDCPRGFSGKSASARELGHSTLRREDNLSPMFHVALSWE